MSYFDTLTLNHSIDFNNLQSLPAKWKADDEKRKGKIDYKEKIDNSEKYRNSRYNPKSKVILKKAEKEFDVYKIYNDFPRRELKYPPVIPLAIREPDTWHCKFCSQICGGAKFEGGYCNEECYHLDFSRPKEDSKRFYYSDSLK